MAKKGTALELSVEAVVGEVSGLLEPVFEQIDWAEEEIKKAQTRHPRQRNVLWHSFGLLQPTHSRMEREFVYRSHCRELLERVAAGRCTKPGTAAEAALALCQASQMAPLNTAAFGLYARMWKLAGFPRVDKLSEDTVHYEAIASDRIDDCEEWLRGKLAVPSRVLADVQCVGRHHGQPVICEFAQAAALAVAA